MGLASLPQTLKKVLPSHRVHADCRRSLPERVSRRQVAFPHFRRGAQPRIGKANVVPPLRREHGKLLTGR
jgi:hypothetical protein